MECPKSWRDWRVPAANSAQRDLGCGGLELRPRCLAARWTGTGDGPTGAVGAGVIRFS